MENNQNVVMIQKRTLKLAVGIVSILLVLLITANCVTQNAYKISVFAAISQLSNGKTHTDLKDRKVMRLDHSKSTDDPLGLKRKCQEGRLEGVLLPEYMPDGFALVYADFNEVFGIKSADFIFKNDKQVRIGINLFHYKNASEASERFGFYSGSNGFEMLNVRGKPVLVNSTDKQHVAVFQHENTLYRIETLGVEGSALLTVLFSFR